MNCREYSEKFRAMKTVTFSEPHPGFVTVHVANPLATAAVCVYGGHVMKFAPAGQSEVLWMSEHSYWENGKPIRGGVPVCWPWFGAHPTDPAKTAHGLARFRNWELTGVTEAPSGETVLTVALRDNAETRAIWDHAFILELEVSVGKTLKMALKTTNTGKADFDITEALHTYFTVGDINKVSISGFDGCTYINTLNNEEPVQHGDITFNAETDRIYFAKDSLNTINDPVLNRTIVHTRKNSADSVVWNPWVAKSIRMPDFGDNEFPGMLCLETANVRKHFVTVKAGETHVMSAEIAVK